MSALVFWLKLLEFSAFLLIFIFVFQEPEYDEPSQSSQNEALSETEASMLGNVSNLDFLYSEGDVLEVNVIVKSIVSFSSVCSSIFTIIFSCAPGTFSKR